MTAADARSVFEEVARRRQLLELLREEPMDKPALVERLDVSRSTINRALRRLESLGLVAYHEGAYSTTPTGRLAVDLVEETTSSLGALLSAQRLLSRTGPGFDPPVSLFRDATVVTADEGRHSPVRALIEQLVAADTVRAIGAPFRSNLPTAVRDHLFADSTGAAFRGVVSRRSVEWLAAYHAPELGTLTSSQSHELRVCSDRRPATVLLTGSERTTVTVVVYDDSETPLGVVVSEDPRTVAWAEGSFEAAWRSSSPFESIDLTDYSTAESPSRS